MVELVPREGKSLSSEAQEAVDGRQLLKILAAWLRTVELCVSGGAASAKTGVHHRTQQGDTVV